MQTTEATKVITVKDRIREVFESLPDDAKCDEISRKIEKAIREEKALARMVKRGLEDVRAGRVIDDEEMGRHIRQWTEEKSGKN